MARRAKPAASSRPPVPKPAAPRAHIPATGPTSGAVLVAGVIGGVAICFVLPLPFLGALTWALVLAVLSAPLAARIEARLDRPGVAAIIAVLLVALLVAIPMAFVIERLVAEATLGAVAIQQRVQAGEVERLLDTYPWLAPVGDWVGREVDLPAMIGGVAGWLSGAGASLVRGSILQITEIVLAFYLLFYFLRDRAAARRTIEDWLPLTHAETLRLFARVEDTVHATVYGTVAVAAIQGALGGLMFWFLGLPAPLLWGVVMALLSVVPVLGAFVVWVPAAILLALAGDWISAVILAAWGALVVGSIDNVLRPIFVGNRLKLHTVPAFIAMLGGVLWFGAPGFILGPLAVTVTVLLVETWRARRAAREGVREPAPEPLDPAGTPV